MHKIRNLFRAKTAQKEFRISNFMLFLCASCYRVFILQQPLLTVWLWEIENGYSEPDVSKRYTKYAKNRGKKYTFSKEACQTSTDVIRYNALLLTSPLRLSKMGVGKALVPRPDLSAPSSKVKWKSDYLTSHGTDNHFFFLWSELSRYDQMISIISKINWPRATRRAMMEKKSGFICTPIPEGRENTKLPAPRTDEV